MTASADNPLRYALLLLGYRGRSTRELREKLRKKGFGTEETEKTITHLTTSGYIDDRALAGHLARQAVSNKMLGFAGIRQLLMRRGIPDDIVAEVLSYDEEEELCTVRRLIEKKQRSMSGQPEAKKYRRLMGALARRGYSGSLIRKALKISGRDEVGEE